MSESVAYCQHCGCQTWHVDGVCEWSDGHGKASRFLRCTACARVITRLEWESFRVPSVYRCCDAMDLQPWSPP